MRRFRLLKDLPGIDAGTILCLDDVSDELFIQRDTEHINFTGLLLYQDGSFGIRGGHVVFSASDWLEELSNEYKRWRAKLDETYFFIDTDVEVLPSREGYCSVDDDRYNVGNYFETLDEACARIDYLKALAVVRDDAKGFVPDWKDNSQKKYLVVSGFEEDDKGKVVAFLSTCKSPVAVNGILGFPYFASREDAKASIDKHEKEWKTIFGIKDDEEEE